MEQIDEEARAMINDFGVDAYCEARRREHEASSDAIAKDWGLVASAVARKMSKSIDVDPSTKVAMNAVLAPDRDAAPARQPRLLARLTPAHELMRGLDPKLHRFRIQFARASPDRGPPILTEVEIEALDVSAAIIAAPNITWPPRTIGLRILDSEGREVFSRRKVDRG